MLSKVVGANTKLRAEGPVEIRDIAETAIERNIQHLFAFRRKTRC